MSKLRLARAAEVKSLKINGSEEWSRAKGVCSNRCIITLVILVLSSVSHQTDIIQRGITFPCLFYLGTEEKYFFLYEMQTTQDTKVPAAAGKGGLVINFCQAVFTPPSDSIRLPIETSGAGYYQDIETGQFFALSYFNGYGNTTKWSTERFPLSNDENFQGIKITGNNQGMLSDNLVSTVTFVLICSSGTKGDDYAKTLQVVDWQSSTKAITIQAETEFGCGNQPSWLITLFAMLRNVGHALLLVGALPLLLYGYKTLRVILILVAFLFGLIYSMLFFLEGSNPNLWSPPVILIFMIFGGAVGLMLAHSSYYFPHGTVYFAAIYLGLYCAAQLSGWISLSNRFYVAYLIVHIIFPTLLLYTFHQALKVCTIIVTAFSGAMCLLLFIQVFLTEGMLPSATDYLDPIHVVSNYPTTFFVLVLLTTLGVLCQQYVYSKTDALKVGYVSQVVIAIQPPQTQDNQRRTNAGAEGRRPRNPEADRQEQLQRHQDLLRHQQRPNQPLAAGHNNQGVAEPAPAPAVPEDEPDLEQGEALLPPPADQQVLPAGPQQPAAEA